LAANAYKGTTLKPFKVYHVTSEQQGTSSHIGGGDCRTGIDYLPIKANQPTIVYVPINCTYLSSDPDMQDHGVTYPPDDLSLVF